MMRRSKSVPSANPLNPYGMLVVGLIVGLLLGYFARPLLTPAAEKPTPLPVGTSPTEEKPTPLPVGISPTEEKPSLTPENSVVARVRHFRGNPDAPVTMIEFADFQCPFCGRFARETAPLIQQAYIESGVVRWGYLHFAFLGPESVEAAQASECAAEQREFWAYHDLLYERQAGENRGAFSKENLKSFAQELGLDMAAFAECLDGGKYADVVNADSSLARSLGISGTPAFWINGRILVGALPFNLFEEAIENARKESGW